MPRRKRESNAEHMISLVSLLPPWLGLVLAVASYMILHWLAKRPAAPIDPTHIGNAMPVILVQGLAVPMQFLVPVLCIGGAVWSFIKRRQRSGLVNTVTASRSADALNAMTWGEFELLVGQAFRMQGYAVQEHGGSQPDGGVDLVLKKGSETFLVQCKQWKALKVGVDVVRELYGVMAAQGAAGGFVVTSGTFTQDAVAFAEGRNLRLVDGARLFGLLQQARSAPASVKAPVPESESPTCPKCAAPMLRRTAKKGANAGGQFWGCSKFPACYGTR